jgi:hypothetical protein
LIESGQERIGGRYRGAAMTCYTQLTTPVEGFEIAEVIRTFVAKHLGLHIRLVTDEARFSDLGADWLDRLELLMRIED